MLDSITQETAKLQKQLGPTDKLILDEYLTNVRDVEQQLDRMEKRAGTLPDGTTAPVGIPDTFDEHMTVTYDLMRLAFRGIFRGCSRSWWVMKEAAGVMRTSACRSRIIRHHTMATSRRTLNDTRS